VRIPGDRQILKVFQGERGTSLRQDARCRTTAKNGEDLEVDEVRRVNLRFPGQSSAGDVPVGFVVGQRDGEDGGVDDDQKRSRSARTSLAAAARLTRPPVRPAERARTSWTVGFSASWFTVARRYSWRDCPDAAACSGGSPGVASEPVALWKLAPR
jgi:hypothetical protein